MSAKCIEIISERVKRMMGENKDILPISVLIPTMNRPKTLEKTLTSYYEGKSVPSQIVIVDQSTDILNRDKIKKMLDAIEYPVSKEYVYQEIASSTKARNNAMRYAEEEIIIFSDDDIDINVDTLSNVFNLMQDETIALIAGIDENAGKSKTNVGYILGTKSFKNRHIGHVTLSILGRYPDKVCGEVETQWAMGYFFVVRKSLIDKWQMQWDEKLLEYAFSEDLDFSFRYYRRAKKENKKCILHDKVRVKHLVSKEYRVPSKKNTYMYVLHRAYLAHKLRLTCGCGQRMACAWCDLWRLTQRILLRENACDMWNAMQYLRKNREKVYKGEFYYGD